MPFILTGNVGSATAATALVSNSVRFNRSDDSFMSRTFGTPTNRKKFTVSFWIKRSGLTISGGMALFGSDGGNTSNFSTIHFNPTDDLCVGAASGGPDDINLVTDRKFRDPGAWYHICVIFDSTQGTDTNRVKIYVNGIQETSFSSNTYPSQNEEFLFNQGTKVHTIGKFPYGTSVLSIDGYISEFVFIDGTTTSITDFGEFDSDTPSVWKPIDVSGLTFGNNGFYLDFEDSADLDTDVSGNGNDFSGTNVEAIDQSTDTCVNNFATLNPLTHNGDSLTQAGDLSEGNLKLVSSNAYKIAPSTIAVSSGKWYVEHKITGGSPDVLIGVIDVQDYEGDGNISYAGQNTNSVGYYKDGRKFIGNSATSYGATYTTNDIIAIALDLDSGTKTITFYKNGASQGSINLPTGGIQEFYFLPSPYNATVQINFGSPPYSESGGNSDGNGYGNFAASVPSGHFALNTKNLAEYG